MNISPRTGRVTLTKMDKQMVSRFAQLTETMHHHLSRSPNAQDQAIGRVANVAGRFATNLLMVIEGYEMPETCGLKEDATVESEPEENTESQPDVTEAVSEPTVAPVAESAPKAKTKRS